MADELISRQAALDAVKFKTIDDGGVVDDCIMQVLALAKSKIDKLPAVDAVPVVRCQNCAHSVPLERNCELNTSVYMHCTLYRGEETRNVWHKYKKYYKDYSIVDRDGYCDEGERREENAAD